MGGTSSSTHPYVDTVKSNDSDKTLSGSSDSIGTAYRLDSQDSTTSVEGREGSFMTPRIGLTHRAILPLLKAATSHDIAYGLDLQCLESRDQRVCVCVA